MSSIYLFDVDGTLTAPKIKIDPTFAIEFVRWMEDKEVYIVSGGSFIRIIDQLGAPITDKVRGVFACLGNIFYQRREQVNYSGMNEWEIIYENKFDAPKNLTRTLNSCVSKSDYHTKTGNHHEVRAGMLNFSIVGRNASQNQRKEYAAYDAEHGERVQLVNKLKSRYDQLDFVIGGAVSIDIFNRGNDKSQIIERYFYEAIEHNRIHFVGDRIAFPGNDYSLAIALEQHPNGHAYEVETWEDTVKLLKTDAFA